MNEILSLALNVWKHFILVLKLPAPSGHLAKRLIILLEFSKSVVLKLVSG